MYSLPKHYPLPLKQILVLGIISVVILAVLLRPTDSTLIAIKPQVTFNQGIYMRRGPSDRFNPPIGSYAAGQTADILAKNTAGNWYKVRGANGEGWVSAEFVTTTGDLSQISVVTSNANLVLGNVLLPLICGQTVEMKIDVANLGREATETYGFISVKDYWNGQEQNTTTGAFPIIEPGQTVTVAGIFLTVSCNNGNLEHKLIVTLNPGGIVPESTLTDNSREYTYVLQDS